MTLKITAADLPLTRQAKQGDYLMISNMLIGCPLFCSARACPALQQIIRKQKLQPFTGQVLLYKNKQKQPLPILYTISKLLFPLG